jgi:hypothetical protein
MSASNTSPSANGRGSGSWSRSHMSISRRGRGYCRVTFDHPPINTITATTVAELPELVGLIESGCAGVASSIAVMVGEQVVVELVAATIEAQQRSEVWSRRVVVVHCEHVMSLNRAASFDARMRKRALPPPSERTMKIAMRGDRDAWRRPAVSAGGGHYDRCLWH